MVESPIDSTQTLPYVLDLIPHLQVGDSGPLDNLRLAMSRWGNLSKPHMVADAAFGSFDILKEISEWGGMGTFSCSSGNTPWLWEMLSTNLPPHSWRAAINVELGVVASIHTATDDKGKKTHQQLLSTGWDTTLKLPSIEEGVVGTGQPTQMPRFSKEALTKMTVEDLKKICKTYNIRQGKKKEDFVNKIAKRSATFHEHAQLIDILLQSIKMDYLTDPAPLHDFYKEHFNLVDLADRRWYSVEEHHQHHKWQSKVILSMLRTAVMNSWVFATKLEYHVWLSWREQLFQQLMQK